MIYGALDSVYDGSELDYEITGISPLNELSYISSMPKIDDQGHTPYCIPYSLQGFFGWWEKLNGEKIEYDLEDIFIGSGGVENGTTFKGALSYVKKKGYIDAYAKIGSLPQLKDALLVYGPCIFGSLPVYDSSFDNFWIPRGELQGYHAITIVGYDSHHLLIRNSWGSRWGDRGYVRMKNDDFMKFKEMWIAIK